MKTNTSSFLRAFAICAVIFVVAAHAEDLRIGVFYDAASGNYTINYPALDVDDEPYIDSVLWVPATKIIPVIKSKFLLDKKTDAISYQYLIKNGARAEQSLSGVVLARVIGSAEDQKIPVGWRGGVVQGDKPDEYRVAWYHPGSDAAAGLLHGAQLRGFGFRGNNLPGVGLMELSGTAPRIEWGGEIDPDSDLGKQVSKLRNNNFVPKVAAIPLIVVSTPFDAAVTLSAMQQHIKKDLITMKLVDPVFAAKLDALLQTAIDAAKGGATGALTNNLKYFRQAIQQASPGVGEDDDDGDADNGDDDSADGKAGNPNRLIDKLAARVLFFDVKYIEKRLSGNKQDQDD